MAFALAELLLPADDNFCLLIVAATSDTQEGLNYDDFVKFYF